MKIRIHLRFLKLKCLIIFDNYKVYTGLEAYHLIRDLLLFKQIDFKLFRNLYRYFFRINLLDLTI